jgi:hypothetical protein
VDSHIRFQLTKLLLCFNFFFLGFNLKNKPKICIFRGNFNKQVFDKNLLSKDSLLYVDKAEADILPILDKYQLSTTEVNVLLQNIQNLSDKKESLDKKSNRDKYSILMSSLIVSFSTEQFMSQIEDVYNKTKNKKNYRLGRDAQSIHSIT